MNKSILSLMALAGSIAMWSTAWAAKEAEPAARGARNLASIPTGNTVIYLGTGLRSSMNQDAAVAVHCTSYNRETSPPSVYPFNMVVEFYADTGNLVGALTLAMPEQDGTRTATSQSIPIYTADTVGALVVQQGSLRVYAPSKRAAAILCSADVSSKVSPPNFQRDVPLTRVGPKFKAPKTIFTP